MLPKVELLFKKVNVIAILTTGMNISFYYRVLFVRKCSRSFFKEFLLFVAKIKTKGGITCAIT